MNRLTTYLVIDDETGLDSIAVQESSIGKYVLFEDAQSVIIAKDMEIAELKADAAIVRKIRAIRGGAALGTPCACEFDIGDVQLKRCALHADMAKDVDRLNFVLTNFALISQMEIEPGIKQFQLWVLSDVNPNEYWALRSGANMFFNTPREAIDAAIALEQSNGAQDETPNP